MSHFDNDKALLAAIKDLKKAVEAGNDLLRVALRSLDAIEKRSSGGPVHVVAHPYDPSLDPSSDHYNKYKDWGG